MMAKAKVFMSMRPHMRRLVLESFIYLAWARILKAMPFARVAPSLGKQLEETTYARDKTNERLLHQVSRAVHLASRHTWWESKCLVMAIAAMKMLERRRIGSTLYLGTAKDAVTGRMVAHAWLRSGVLYLTGADEMSKYTVVATFGKTIPHKEN
nr:lasso peptide biosynthesis B2 protein [Paenibacillus oenotherae]